MGCSIIQLKLSKNSSAVSDVISLILVVIIMVSTISVVLVWGIPEINKNKAYNRAENALSQFNLIGDLIIEDVVGQGYNSSKNIRFSLDLGTISVSSSETRFVFYYSLREGFDFNVSGFFDEYYNKFYFYNDGTAQDVEIHYLGQSTKVTKTAPADEGTITVNDPLNNAIKIVVKDSSNEIIGMIWYFEIGAIVYNDYSEGSYRVSIENGAVISENSIQNLPNFIAEKNLIYIHLIKLIDKDVTAVSWGGIDQTPVSINMNLEKINQKSSTIKFNIKNNETFIREDKANIVNTFKINVSGNKKSENAWREYFTDILGYKTYDTGDAKETLYITNQDNFIFTFIQSNCDVSLEVA